MDGFVSTDVGRDVPTPFPGGFGRVERRAGLSIRRLDGAQAATLSKFVPGFDGDAVEAAAGLVRDAAAGRLGPLKFLAFDFACDSIPDAPAAAGFGALVRETANLVLAAPAVTVAYARGHVAGADLELALVCNMLVAEAGASFSFAVDPVVSVRAYALLAQKIGFVRAERLMEAEAVVSAVEMRDLFLAKAVVEAGAGFAGLGDFLARSVRRHNASFGIYRAQRIAMPLNLLEDAGQAEAAGLVRAS